MSDLQPRDVSPRDIGALVELIKQNRVREAESGARTLLERYPDAGMLWKILSVALLRQGGDALPALRRAADLLPEDAEAFGNLGEALFERGRWAESLASFQNALALEPQDASSLVHAADALRALGRVRESLPLYHRALTVEPRHRQALNNLGNAFLQLKQYADAVGHYRLALDVTPGDGQIWCNLGTAQRLLGYREEAIASYRQALILNSKDIDALNHLAHLLRDIGLRRDAVALYARAIQTDPNRADSHCNLGMVLFEMRRIDDAVAAFQQALALQPSHAAAHLNLGLALRQKRRPADAEASCRTALGLEPTYVDALAFLGELLADRGQFVGAEELFRQALAINPRFAPALSSIATHRKMTAADAAWAESAESLLAQPMPVMHEIGLHYSLGKYYDDVKRYDDAFAQYRLANELSRRLGPDYDAAKLDRYVAGIARTFDATFMQRTQTRAAVGRSDAPILIIGMPRSGTSLAEQILASHPAVFGAGEVAFWNAAYHEYQDHERGGVDGAAAILARMADEYLGLLASISGGAPRIVDKLPANFLYAGMIHAALPNARIIHMRRHPIDTCLSIYFQNFFNIGPYANDLNSLADYHRQYTRITRHWRDLLPATALLEVPYEGLLEDQEAWTRRMLEFAGLPWDSRCLEFDKTERVVITASKWQVRQPLHAGSSGRWKHYEQYLGPLSSL
jgi:tetratricopeptide (TPR) repeat protein